MLIPLWLKVKAVTAEVISDLGGNKVCAAAASRIERHATFSDYANPNEIKRVIPLDTAIELDAFNLRSGKPARMIELAAAELGCVLIKLPDGHGIETVIEGSGQLAAKLGAIMTEVGAALADGKIDAAEAARIIEKVNRLIVIAHAFARQIEREAEEEGA